MTKKREVVETPTFTTVLSVYDDLDLDDCKKVMFLVLEHLKLQVVVTNATKHGDPQLQLRPEES